ncbi:MAG: hypothetical protein AAFY46_16105 [Planctomycetota bacterium]
MMSIRRATALAVLVAAGASAAQSAPEAYSFVELELLPGDSASTVTAVNSLGRAAGWSGEVGSRRAVIWDTDGNVTTLGLLPGATESFSMDIKD